MPFQVFGGDGNWLDTRILGVWSGTQWDVPKTVEIWTGQAWEIVLRPWRVTGGVVGNYVFPDPPNNTVYGCQIEGTFLSPHVVFGELLWGEWSDPPLGRMVGMTWGKYTTTIVDPVLGPQDGHTYYMSVSVENTNGDEWLTLDNMIMVHWQFEDHGNEPKFSREGSEFSNVINYGNIETGGSWGWTSKFSMTEETLDSVGPPDWYPQDSSGEKHRINFNVEGTE